VVRAHDGLPGGCTQAVLQRQSSHGAEESISKFMPTTVGSVPSWPLAGPLAGSSGRHYKGFSVNLLTLLT
jgi:hypothetical protein